MEVEYHYRFHINNSCIGHILLQQSDFTDITKRQNVSFLPPRSACHIDTPPPKPFREESEDRAEEAADRAGQEQGEPSRAAEEHPCGARRFHFTPYSEQSIKKIKCAVRELTKEVKELRQKMDCHLAVGCSKPTPKKTAPKRKAPSSPTSSNPSINLSSDAGSF